ARIPPETWSQRQHRLLAESASSSTPPLPDTPQLPRALPQWQSRSTVLTYTRTTPLTALATRPPPAVATGHSPGAKTTPSPPAPTPIAPEPTTPMLTDLTAPPPATDTEAATAYNDYTTTHLPPTQRLYLYRTLTGSRVPGPVQQMQRGRLPQATSSSHTMLPTPGRDLQDPSTGLLQPATTTTTLLHQELFKGDLSPTPPSVPPTPPTSTTPPLPLPSSTSVAASQRTNLLQHQPTME
ncbi:hypothetical protein C0992_003989, partial [Termitomyces sp. T32_za158]